MLRHHCSSLKANREGTWKQELIQRLCLLGAVFWVLPHGFLSLLIEPVTTNPGVVPPTIDRALQHHKMVYRLMYNLIFWRHFLDGGFLVSDDYSSDVKLV